jgi:hypothetical protein
VHWFLIKCVIRQVIVGCILFGNFPGLAPRRLGFFWYRISAVAAITGKILGMDDEYEIVMSPLSRKVTKDGFTVEIMIYHDGDDDEWHLEVVDQEEGSTVWGDPFPTDQAALDEVMRTIEEEGIATFLVPPDSTVH